MFISQNQSEKSIRNQKIFLFHSSIKWFDRFLKTVTHRYTIQHVPQDHIHYFSNEILFLFTNHSLTVMIYFLADMIYGTCNLFSTLLLKVGRCCINYVLLAGKQSGGEIWQLPSAECIFNLSITFAHLHNNKRAINHHEIPQSASH